MRVCLIEPNALRRSIYARHLNALGHSVVEEPLSSDAPACAEAMCPSTMIADLSGEGPRPTQMLGMLRRRFPTAPFILLLGMEQSVTAAEALAFGVQALLRDPVRLEELDLHLARCLGNDSREAPARKTRACRPKARSHATQAVETVRT
jgi:DNA-binding NtrC family response regulator